MPILIFNHNTFYLKKKKKKIPFENLNSKATQKYLVGRVPNKGHFLPKQSGPTSKHVFTKSGSNTIQAPRHYKIEREMKPMMDVDDDSNPKKFHRVRGRRRRTPTGRTNNRRETRVDESG